MLGKESLMRCTRRDRVTTSGVARPSVEADGSLSSFFADVWLYGAFWWAEGDYCRNRGAGFSRRIRADHAVAYPAHDRHFDGNPQRVHPVNRLIRFVNTPRFAIDCTAHADGHDQSRHPRRHCRVAGPRRLEKQAGVVAEARRVARRLGLRDGDGVRLAAEPPVPLVQGRTFPFAETSCPRITCLTGSTLQLAASGFSGH
jgi:hypothetical protein